MKSYSNILMTVVFIISVMSFLSETSFAQETHDKAEADEQAIRFLEEQERMGVLNQDFHALEQIWSEHFMVNSPRKGVESCQITQHFYPSARNMCFRDG
jgi:hypothetical protein